MGILGRKIIFQGKGPHHGSVGRIIPKHRKAGIQDAVTYMKYIIHNPGNCSKKQHKKQNFLPRRQHGLQLLLTVL